MVAIVFILWLAAELAAVIAVAHAIGILLCVVLLVAGWPLGTWLMRAEGRTALARLQAAIAADRSPGGEIADGALALLAGALFIVPGFVTDAFGLALLVPAIRRRTATVVSRHARSRLFTRAARFGGARRAYDVDSVARDAPPADRPQLHG